MSPHNLTVKSDKINQKTTYTYSYLLFFDHKIQTITLKLHPFDSLCKLCPQSNFLSAFLSGIPGNLS